MREKTAIGKIEELNRFGMKLGLERMAALMERLGNPQRKLKALHVAGTNGKGSVCKFLYEALQSNGYRTGLFTSPYIREFCERIQLNGDCISEEDLEQYSQKVLHAVDAMTAAGGESPTEFEVVTAIAFLYFAEKGAQLVVLETGLGGRGDSTNLIESPLATVITSISYDHIDRLGSTLVEIASEKAGIIKPGVPVICNVEDTEAAKVIARTAYRNGCKLYDMTKIRYRVRSESIYEYEADMNLYGTDYSGVKITMAGRHQLENLKTALATIEILRKSGIITIERTRLYEGLAKARQPARMEPVGTEPLFLLDGAHNRAGAQALAETVKHFFAGYKIVMITGMLRDKEISKILDAFTEITDTFIVMEPDNPRKLPAGELQEALQARGMKSQIAETAQEAISLAKACKPQIAVAAGSLYLVGTLKGALDNEA